MQEASSSARVILGPSVLAGIAAPRIPRWNLRFANPLNGELFSHCRRSCRSQRGPHSEGREPSLWAALLAIGFHSQAVRCHGSVEPSGAAWRMEEA